jgi:ATP-dependent Lhr-like helicase
VLAAYPEYRRVTVNAENIHRVKDAAIARRHRASLGTIVSDASISVQFANGARIGSVEEAFVSRLNAGDCFVIGGRIVEFVRVKEMTAWVRRAPAGRGIVPRWMGGKMPLSNELARSVRSTLDAARAGRFDAPELHAVRPLLEIQARCSRIPGADELLIERHETREGHHLFFFPFAGRHVHTGLSALVAWRLGQRAPASFSMAVNDYGFELVSPTPVDVEGALADGLLSPEQLPEQLRASLNAAELAKRQFREIARVAGLVFQGYPGDPKTAKQLQVSSGLLFDVFTRHDPENLLLRQAEEEVLERQLEYSRLEATLRDLQGKPVTIVAPTRMTPFALPLLAEHLREKLSTEKLADRVQRMQVEMRKGS